MSIIFGIHRPEGELATGAELYQMSQATARYAAEGSSFYKSGPVGFGFQPNHTHSRSRLHLAPEADQRGNAILFDGRLDNYDDLRRSLGHRSNESDAAIALALFVKWGDQCFARLIGEWALALWSANERAVYLARDHAGTRTLYFALRSSVLRWSTHLETLVLGNETSSLSNEYLVRYIAGLPVRTATPYQHIDAVAPAQYVVVKNQSVRKGYYWHSSDQPHLCLKSESEYVERFQALLGQAVARRAGAGSKILAQLSGGMDSSAIVCMSDHLRKINPCSIQFLDTISFFDDFEASWNERPYVAAVEAQRGNVGTHVRTDSVAQTYLPAEKEMGVYLLPGADSSSVVWESVLKTVIADRGYRVVLSGIGGDEVLGGVPDPFPELSSLLASYQWRLLLSQGVEWCLAKRISLIRLLLKTVSFTGRVYLKPSRVYATRFPEWLRSHCLFGAQEAIDDTMLLRGVRNRKPEDICNRLAWWSALNTLPSGLPDYLARYEYRYPLLDRDLVEFAFSIPRNQLVRPGRRRYLMRKALVGIVPTEILERKRKAFVARGPLVLLREAKEAARSALDGSLVADLGLIDRVKFKAALDLVLRAEHLDSMVPLLRALNVELWLQSKVNSAVVSRNSELATTLRRNAGANKLRSEVVSCQVR